MSDAIPYKQIIDRVKSDIDWIAEQAHAKGYNEAKLIYQNPNAKSDYQRGLEDAWETITKIAKMPDGERRKVFGDTWVSNILKKYSVSEIITILGKHESEPDEIKVGDEVTPKSNDSNWLGVVVGVDDTNAMVMTRDGYTAMYRLEILQKTDKYFPQVAELLKAMNGEQWNCSACEHDGDPRFCDQCRHNDMWQPKEVTE